MIRKLRRQFVIIIMSVVAVLMIAAFLGVLISTSVNLERQNQFTLSDALRRMKGPPVYGARPGGGPGDRPMPLLTVSADTSGGVESFSNQIFNFSDGDIQTVVRLALARGTASGILREYNLRFMTEEDADGSTRLAFIDNSMESHVIANLLTSSAIIGVSTLLLFLLVSIFLSRWVSRPVETAWNSQRRFVADASHELKTPLTVILSNSALLSGDGLAGKKAETRLGNILAEATRMKILVDELLTLARSDDAAGARIVGKVDFSAAVLSAALRFEPVIFDLGKTFGYEIADGLTVDGDAAGLDRLIEVLLDNACRHSTPGSLISVSARTAGKNDVCLEVSNGSETIAEAELEKIFERFYRLDKSRSGGGYGLGLSIASAVVREHGGKIRAASGNGRTVFSVTLPGAR